jgi:hypothetical protein
MLLTASQTVTLKGGIVVSVDALKLLWSLEDRGCDVRVDGGGALRLLGKVTERDREAVRAHQQDVLNIVRYCAASAT